MYDFMERFAPHLTRNVVDQAIALKNAAEINQMFESMDLPIR